MKKGILLTMLFMATASYAQTVLWDGENSEITSRNANGGWWDRGNPSVVDNPEKDGINTSAKCLKFTMTGNDFGQKHVALPFRDWITPNLKGNRRISFMIKKSVNENVKVEISDPTNGAAGYWEKVVAWYGGSGKWQKIVLDFSTNTGMNDFPGVLAIEAQTASVTENQDVYIDNVVIEEMPMVGTTPLKDVADNTLTGNIVVTGALMKGECQNANGEWFAVEYNDFATLENKLSNTITSVDLRGTTIYNGYNSTRGKNFNCIVFAKEAFPDNAEHNANDNVVIGAAGSNSVGFLDLNESYSFATPEDFHADAVKVTRSLQAGTNTLCLPFYVGQAEISTNCKIATYASSTASAVNFTYADHADANIPFLATAVDAAVTELNFTDKGVVNTPATFSEPFIGIYTPQTAANKYGINNDGKFQNGGSTSTINSFHALLTSVPSEARGITIDGETTGISNISLENPVQTIYNLHGVRVNQMSNKGIYIINGKKVIVK